MKKDTPVFKDQAIVKPANFDDYRMNTPLQNVSNYPKLIMLGATLIQDKKEYSEI